MFLFLWKSICTQQTDSNPSQSLWKIPPSLETPVSRSLLHRNMIPCFPPISVLMCITVTLYWVVPRHLILHRILLLILPKSEPGQLQKNYTTAWKIKKDIIWEMKYAHAHAAIHLRTINQFLKLVYCRFLQEK